MFPFFLAVAGYVVGRAVKDYIDYSQKRNQYQLPSEDDDLLDLILDADYEILDPPNSTDERRRSRRGRASRR